MKKVTNKTAVYMGIKAGTISDDNDLLGQVTDGNKDVHDWFALTSEANRKYRSKLVDLLNEIQDYVYTASPNIQKAYRFACSHMYEPQTPPLKVDNLDSGDMLAVLDMFQRNLEDLRDNPREL